MVESHPGVLTFGVLLVNLKVLRRAFPHLEYCTSRRETRFQCKSQLLHNSDTNLQLSPYLNHPSLMPRDSSKAAALPQLGIGIGIGKASDGLNKSKKRRNQDLSHLSLSVGNSGKYPANCPGELIPVFYPQLVPVLGIPLRLVLILNFNFLAQPQSLPQSCLRRHVSSNTTKVEYSKPMHNPQNLN